MSAKPRSRQVYVNARPESVLVRESYTYEIRIQANSDTHLVDTPGHPDQPRGEISVEIPYDGHVCFPAESARKVMTSVEITRRPFALAGQIGWLALSPPLDWEREWRSPEGIDLLPVQIPLLDENIRGPDVWMLDELRALSWHEYQPESPAFLPLQVEMQVYDTAQDSLESFLKTRRFLEKGQDVLEVADILKDLNGEPLQGGRLVVDFGITAYLPAILAQNVREVCLDELELKWPTIAPSWQLSIFTIHPGGKSEEVSWRYDPDHQSVEVHSIPAFPRQPEEGAPLVPYRCDLRIRLDFPGQVVSQDELEGCVRLRLDGCLLSGRQVGWLDAGGKRIDARDGMITVETILAARFRAVLSDRFRYRRTAAYRQLYFSGVRLSPTRMDDIAAAMRDIGYEITDLGTEWGKELENPALIHVNLSGKGDDRKRSIDVGAVVAQRVETSPEQDPAILEIRVWAIPVAAALTRREREIPEGGSVSTEWGTSDLILQMRGQMSGSGSLLALDMDRLMVNLKNRFATVADLR